MNGTGADTDQKYIFEVSLVFGSESYRSAAYLPNWLNPWRYRAQQRALRRATDTADDHWKQWDLNNTDEVPGEYSPYTVRVRNSDDTYIFEWVCRVDVSASSEQNAHERVSTGLAQHCETYGVKPFDSARFAHQIDSANTTPSDK